MFYQCLSIYMVVGLLFAGYALWCVRKLDRLSDEEVEQKKASLRFIYTQLDAMGMWVFVVLIVTVWPLIAYGWIKMSLQKPDQSGKGD